MKIKYFLFLLASFACNSKDASHSAINKKSSKQIVCSNEFCHGKYIGKEFIEGSDVAHQFSNKMSEVVGEKLKELYDAGNYSKVDFSKIEMSTEGMGSGFVEYDLKIPFQPVRTKCEAYTAFDHVGGWNHAPELSKRKAQLKNALLPTEKLAISELKKTKEGLQEYWIQWKHQEKQKNCVRGDK